MKKTTKARAGFSLIEMIVVIGIIAILAAVTISQFSGTTERARTTQCMANMRNLANAVQGCAMANEDGHYPAAGTYRYPRFDRGKEEFHVYKGWISWGKVNESASVSDYGSKIVFSESDDETRKYAITNGAVWSHTGYNFGTYLCPVHAKACNKKNKKDPGWSYVMNEKFGYDQGESQPTRWQGKVLGSLSISDMKGKNFTRAPDKVLLFAEIQAITVDGTELKENLDGSGDEGDGVLQCEKETIGFNHKLSSGRFIGHVAFADGHVAPMMYPKNGSLKTLTEDLCCGYDLSFNGSRYERMGSDGDGD